MTATHASAVALTPNGSRQAALTTTITPTPVRTSFLADTTTLLTSQTAVIYIEAVALDAIPTEISPTTTTNKTVSTVSSTGATTTETLTTATTKTTWSAIPTDLETTGGTCTPSTTSVTQTTSITTSASSPAKTTTTLTTTSTQSIDGRLNVTTYTTTKAVTTASGVSLPNETNTVTITSFNTDPVANTSSPAATSGSMNITIKEEANALTGITTQTITALQTSSTGAFVSNVYTKAFASNAAATSTSTYTSNTNTTTSSLAIASFDLTHSVGDNASLAGVNQSLNSADSKVTSTNFFVTNSGTSSSVVSGSTTTTTKMFRGTYSETTGSGWVQSAIEGADGAPTTTGRALSNNHNSTTLTTSAYYLDQTQASPFSDVSTALHALTNKSNLSNGTVRSLEDDSTNVVVSKKYISDLSTNYDTAQGLAIGFGVLSGILGLLLCIRHRRIASAFTAGYDEGHADASAQTTRYLQLSRDAFSTVHELQLRRAVGDNGGLGQRDLFASLIAQIMDQAPNMAYRTNQDGSISIFNRANGDVIPIDHVIGRATPNPPRLPAVPNQPSPQLLGHALQVAEEGYSVPVVPLPDGHQVLDGVIDNQDGAAVVLGHAPVRRLNTVGGTITLVELIRYDIQTAHGMAFVNPDKFSLLLDINLKLSTLLKSPSLSAADRQTIQNELIPQINAESLSIFAYNVDTYGIDKVVSSLFLAVDTSSINTWTNNNHWKSKSYFTNPSFFDPTKVTILAQPSNGRTRYVNLVGEDTQYNGASIDAVKDIVSLSPVGNRTYNINTSNGDDVVLLDYSLYTGIGSTVNLLGGIGRDTFIIKVKNGLFNLQGKITILDFNVDEDKIIFDTDVDNYLTPKIKQTWHGSILSTVQTQEYGNGTVQLYSSTPAWWEWFKSSRGRIDTFEGTGIPMVEVWMESCGNALADTKPTSNGAIRITSSSSDLSASPTLTQAFLLPSNTYQTTYSQFEDTHDADSFKMGLLAGRFYRFRITAAPGVSHIISDTGPVSKTQLYVSKQEENGQETLVNVGVTPVIDNHDYEINFYAQSNGLYYLHAYSDVETPVGAYQIEYKEVVSQTFTPFSSPLLLVNYLEQGSFVGDRDTKVFTVDLVAGQYNSLIDIGNKGYVSFYDPHGNRIQAKTVGFPFSSTYAFLANETGKYSLVLDDNTANPDQNFSISMRSTSEIEAGTDTGAELKANVTIKNKFETVGDHDWFRVNLQGGTKYQIDLKNAGATYLDSYLYLRDAAGNLLGKDRLGHDAYDDDSGGWPNSRLIYQVATTGTYYIDAGTWRNGYQGDYSLTYKVI